MHPLRLALLASFATFLLLIAGGLVKPTGSSLACPDWPLCNGEIFPAMTGGVEYEHSHRLAALAVSLFTFWLVIQVWRSPAMSRRVRILSSILLPLIGVQAALGAITVLKKLPAPVSTAHLGLSMIFFLCLMTCAHWLAQAPVRDRIEAALPRFAALVALVAVYLQILLGGFIRHTGASRTCGLDFPLCGGEWWPLSWAARANQLHRGMGIVVTLIVIAAAIPTYRAAARSGRRLARACALAAPFLCVAQVFIGIATVRSGIGLGEVMAHFIVGMTLLATCHAAYMGLGPRWKEAPSQEAASSRAMVEAT